MSLEACAGLVGRGDPDRFAAVVAAPADARAVLLPLYAFNVEVSRAPWVTAEPMIAEMRLQWWRDALEEIGQGGPVRRHEVVDALAPVLDAAAAEELDQLVAARRWDCYRDPFDDAAAFEAYINATSGNLTWVAARALGATDEQAVRDVGYAIGVANWLRAIPQLEALGRVPLVDGRTEAVAALAQGALARLTRVSKPARPAVLSGWQARGILKLAAKDPAAVAQGGLVPSEFARRGGLLKAALTGRI
ncbi:hypothetical protein ATO10_02410 [Actibacterium atlanticum]|uniref:Phytoene synthase n=1 Tax=Actibacterium atlanticum TaxID=1461693 RepID=A0A058ZRU7_9RHOB|nr:squalene/phytoene synthase family protein [Actibacterium atlanticum]KCV83576.1 hypothetical protein ATO10_02410 [Actibacterium atlanticum]